MSSVWRTGRSFGAGLRVGSEVVTMGLRRAEKRGGLEQRFRAYGPVCVCAGSEEGVGRAGLDPRIHM